MFAIAEFGSSCRGDADKISDRDLLIVCAPMERRSFYEAYSAKGYSVSLYTEKQLRFMQKSGSLFIQHLRRESRIVFDSGGEFRAFLESSQLVRPSENELRRCQQSIEFFLNWPPNYRLSEFRSDVLYCLFRDYLIKALAREGLIAFGLRDIEIECSRLWSIDSNALHSMHLLRESKASYRGSPANLRSHVPVDLSVLLEGMVRISKWSAHDGCSDCLDLAELKTRSYTSPYELLRTMEAVYLLARSDGYVHPSHELLMHYISMPNLYRSSQAFRQKDLKLFLDEFIDVVLDGSIGKRNSHAPPLSNRPRRWRILGVHEIELAELDA